MERHRCKLCYRRFSNGRALGGHMRSHVIAHPAPAKPPPPPPPPVTHSPTASSSSFSAEEAAAPAAVPEEKSLGTYSLRENPRKSFRLADPEFSASFVAAAGSSIVQDGESDAESSLHRRPKRRSRDLAGDGEPLSCISDASPEEDVARCLMMLSRDAWSKSEAAEEHQSNDGDEDEEMEDYELYEEDEEERVAVRSLRRRTRFQCGTCRKVFRSYQALGGHRASHKRVGIECVPPGGNQIHGDGSYEVNAATADHDAKLFECPYCYRIFSSGQALGGHKRSHFSSSSAAARTTTSFPALHPPRPHSSFNPNNCSIDLNLPASMEEEQELSAVSFTTEFPPK